MDFMAKRDLITKGIKSLLDNQFDIRKMNEEAKLLVNLPKEKEARVALTREVQCLDDSLYDDRFEHALQITYLNRALNSILHILNDTFTKNSITIKSLKTGTLEIDETTKFDYEVFGFEDHLYKDIEDEEVAVGTLTEDGERNVLTVVSSSLVFERELRDVVKLAIEDDEEASDEFDEEDISNINPEDL